MEQIQLYGSSASQDPLSKTANSQSDPGASHELCIAAHLQSDLTKARALHFLIVPFSTTVPSAPQQTFSVVQGRGHTMLQRMQQFGLVKAILLDDLPADDQKRTGKALTAV